MPDVHVYRHGQRWALSEAPAGEPISEYATCSEAESAGRALLRDRGAEGDVVVQSDDPTGLAAVQESGAGEPLTGAGGGGSGDGIAGETGSAGTPERLRESQGGL